MSGEITEEERDAIDEFLEGYFDHEYYEDLDRFSEGTTDDPEIPEADVIEEYIESGRNLYFDRGKGYLGLALSFILTAEQFAAYDSRVAGWTPGLSWEEDLQARYDQKGVDYQEERDLDTLTLRYNDEEFGLRGNINALGSFYHHEVHRTNFPNAPGHYTGNWADFIELLEDSFSLSSSGRKEVAERLLIFGLDVLESKDYPKREPAFPQPFLNVLKEYDRSDDNEPGGLAYQAMVYGYARTEWPHLSFRAFNVRGGSSRQKRFGDIDGYHGPDQMISIEAKDRVIESEDIASELATMVNLADESTVISIAICQEVSDDARRELEEEGVKVITDDDLEIQMRTWDYHKQNLALQGMVHYLEDIERNPTAAQRLLRFVEEIDPENTALAHLHDE